MASIIALFWCFSIFSVGVLSEKQTTANFLKNYLRIRNRNSKSKSNTKFVFYNTKLISKYYKHKEKQKQIKKLTKTFMMMLMRRSSKIVSGALETRGSFLQAEIWCKQDPSHVLWLSHSMLNIRNRPRFFVQVGYETIDACIGKKHFFSK